MQLCPYNLTAAKPLCLYLASWRSVAPRSYIYIMYSCCRSLMVLLDRNLHYLHAFSSLVVNGPVRLPGVPCYWNL